MNNETVDNIIDLSCERAQRVHDLNEKRLQNVRAAFTKALPLAKVTAKTKNKAKKTKH